MGEAPRGRGLGQGGMMRVGRAGLGRGEVGAWYGHGRGDQGGIDAVPLGVTERAIAPIHGTRRAHDASAHAQAVYCGAARGIFGAPATE